MDREKCGHICFLSLPFPSPSIPSVPFFPFSSLFPSPPSPPSFFLFPFSLSFKGRLVSVLPLSKNHPFHKSDNIAQIREVNLGDVDNHFPCFNFEIRL